MFARDDRLSWDMDVKDDYHTYAEITVAIYPYILAAAQVVGQRACVRTCGDKGRLGLITSSRIALDDL